MRKYTWYDQQSVLGHPYLFEVSINCIVQDALAVSFIHHYESINLFQGRKHLTKESFSPAFICLCIHLFIHLLSMHFLSSCDVPGIVLSVEESNPKAQFLFPGLYCLVKGERQANRQLQYSAKWTMKKVTVQGAVGQSNVVFVYLISKWPLNAEINIKWENISPLHSCSKWVLGQCGTAASSVGSGVG